VIEAAQKAAFRNVTDNERGAERRYLEHR